MPNEHRLQLAKTGVCTCFDNHAPLAVAHPPQSVYRVLVLVPGLELSGDICDIWFTNEVQAAG